VLPPDHARQTALIAKAHNRRGDCLLILGHPAEALQAYNISIPLDLADSYPIFNRGRAQLKLGNKDAAKADFTTAADPKFNQPKARKLAVAALAELAANPP